MSFRNPTSTKDLLIHLGSLVGIVIMLVFTVFYIWLPATTNHGDTITVPDVRGLPQQELGPFLEKRSLRYGVTRDSSYSSGQPPLTVLRQFPAPNAKVKENRKIYITLNTEKPPKVRMPKVVDLHMKSAQMLLKSYDLGVGEVKFKSDEIFGVILDAQINGRTVLEGEKIEKGSVIDLIAGDGYGITVLESPDLIGLDREEAEFVIMGSGLKVGMVRESKTATATTKSLNNTGEPREDILQVAPGEVQKQYPAVGTRLQIGDIVDLWVYKPDSINTNTSLLDNQ